MQMIEPRKYPGSFSSMSLKSDSH
jgi:hypothetical protein